MSDTGAKYTHKAEVCSDCWEGWLDAQLASTSALQIACVQCKNILHQNDIQAFALPRTFDRYLDNCIRLCVSNDQDFRWCTSASCTSGQVHDAGLNGNILTCVKCKRKSCLDCNSEWHAGQSCEGFQEEQAALRHWEYLKEVDKGRRSGKISDEAATTLLERSRPTTLAEHAVDEAESSVTVTKHSKPCPGCNVRVQKNSCVSRISYCGNSLTCQQGLRSHAL